MIIARLRMIQFELRTLQYQPGQTPRDNFRLEHVPLGNHVGTLNQTICRHTPVQQTEHVF
jgi:hypothetical protein